MLISACSTTVLLHARLLLRIALQHYSTQVLYTLTFVL